MIDQICDVMMSISTRGKVHFWIYLLNYNSLSHQTWSIDRCKQGQWFSEIFWTIWRTGFKFQVFSHLLTSSNDSVMNYVKFPVFHFFEKVNKGHLKMEKMPKYCYCVTVIKSLKGLQLVSSLQHWIKNMLEIFVIQ